MTFQKGNPVGAQTAVDGALLKTAACVQLADPLVEIGTRHYPTVFDVGSVDNAGTVVGNVTEGSNKSHRARIAADCHHFCVNVVFLWAEIVVGGAAQGVQRAGRGMQTMFELAAEVDAPNRHITGKVVAPFSWIEPTSLFRHMDTSLSTRCQLSTTTG